MLSFVDFTFTATSKSLLFPFQTNPNPNPNSSSLSLTRAQRPYGATPARASAPKKKKKPIKRRTNPLSEMAGIPSFADELGVDFDDDGDEEDDEDGEALMLPLEKMKEWLEKKPRGFGEGKVYDTAIEDQLFEEILQSREAQAANLNKLKSEGVKALDSKRALDKKKANEVVPSGFRVRITNLPKKKNVHRDLTSAFKGVPGLISINPSVIGNKKTRDPICKGFGFVYFNSDKDANRFVETFSRQSIAFGKIQKQIMCEIADSPEPGSSSVKLTNNPNILAPIREVKVMEDDQRAEDSDTESSLSNEWEINISVEIEDADESDEDCESEWEDYDEDYDEDEDEDLESVTELELSPSGSYEQKTESESSLLAEIEKIKTTAKRLSIKDKTAKVPELQTLAKGKNVAKGPKPKKSGSAKRLKGKEKAVMNDVFSKYGKKSALASKK